MDATPHIPEPVGQGPGGEALPVGPASGVDQPAGVTSADPVATTPDVALEELRSLLVTPEQQRVTALEARVADLQERTEDHDALVAAITPVLGDVIRLKIRENRDEMIEALYPIIGQLIGRAVAEAIRDLARTLDARMHPAFDLRSIGRRLQARLAGIPDSALLLRDALPFRVVECFIIHRESGLLLEHLSNSAAPLAETDNEGDSDLISGMLTAIRDFAQDAFGRGQEDQLDEIQYGNWRILIEATRHAYLAVVVEGIQPAGFRMAMREQIIAFENRFSETLVHYDGDAARFSSSETALAQFMAGRGPDQPSAQEGLSAGQKRIVAGLTALLGLCLLAMCVGSAWLLVRPRQTVMIVVTATPGPTNPPTSTATASLTPTLTPTATMTPTRVATSTATSSPTAAPNPAGRLIIDQVNVRQGPGLTYPIVDTATIGTTYTIVGRDAQGGWLQVCCTQTGSLGWVAAALITVEGPVTQLPVATGP